MKCGTGTIRVLVTGFGPFPGVRENPTATIIAALEKYRPRLSRLGIELTLEVLPVTYAEIAPRLDALAKRINPDAILHLGLARRRKVMCIETRAVNRLSLLHRDARKISPPGMRVVPGAPHVLKSTFPAALVSAALGHAGYMSRLSINAGRYVCNQTLYLSLALFPGRPVGFIHIPWPARGHGFGGSKERSSGRPTLADMNHAAVIAILVMASALRRRMVQLDMCGDDGRPAEPGVPLDQCACLP
jgi:pyroglutamyl-peptidase